MRDIGVSVRYRLVPAEIACTGNDHDSLFWLKRNKINKSTNFTPNALS